MLGIILYDQSQKKTSLQPEDQIELWATGGYLRIAVKRYDKYLLLGEGRRDEVMVPFVGGIMMDSNFDMRQIVHFIGGLLIAGGIGEIAKDSSTDYGVIDIL